jgi:hypothetical protein
MGDVAQVGADAETNTATEVDLAQPDTARPLYMISSHARIRISPSIANIDTLGQGCGSTVFASIVRVGIEQPKR